MRLARGDHLGGALDVRRAIAQREISKLRLGRLGQSIGRRIRAVFGSVEPDRITVRLGERGLHPVDPLDAHLRRADERDQAAEGRIPNQPHPAVRCVGAVDERVVRRRVDDRIEVVVESQEAFQPLVRVRGRRFPFESVIDLPDADDLRFVRLRRRLREDGVVPRRVGRRFAIHPIVVASPQIRLSAFQRRSEVESPVERLDRTATGLHTHPMRRGVFDLSK